jgi:AIG2-like family
MIYFAYGSNLNADHLIHYLDTHEIQLDTEQQGKHAFLHNFRLRTNYFAGSHRAGACNIEPAQDHHVEGVLWTITKPIQDALRIKEGFPHRYEETEVIVHTAGTQEPVRAITYVVSPKHRLDVDLPVTTRYRDFVLNGAKHFNLTNDYQKMLQDLLQVVPSLEILASANNV